MSLREAVAPLLEVFGLDAGERGRAVAMIGRDGPASAILGSDEFALAEQEGAGVRRGRSVEERPSGARVGFIDDGGEYQIASAAVSADPPGRAGLLQFDVPVIAGRALAERAARRRLRRALAEADDATVHLSPETALGLEPGDRVRLARVDRVGRVAEVQLDEAPRAKLIAVEAADQGALEGDTDWRPGPPAEATAPPVLHLLDLPPLAGVTAQEETDERPLAAVAGEPWRGVDILASPSATALTVRGRAAEPAGVGETLTELSRGPLHRLHAAGRLRVRVEGAVLASRSWLEVAGGANALVVLHPDGAWEVLQFLRAELVGPGTYLLSLLLRSQAGSDPALSHAAPAGAPVVVLDRALTRVDLGSGERGSPLLWRAVPSGAADPVFITETIATWKGLSRRPWSPAHARARKLADGGLELSWIRRARIEGDPWDGDAPLGEESERYRVQVRTQTRTVRTWEVDKPQALYSAGELINDFPDGASEALTVEVRQGSTSFGWGAPVVLTVIP